MMLHALQCCSSARVDTRGDKYKLLNKEFSLRRTKIFIYRPYNQYLAYEPNCGQMECLPDSCMECTTNNSKTKIKPEKVAIMELAPWWQS